MPVSYNATVKTNRMNQVLNAIDGGAGPGTLEIGTAGMATVLAVLTLSDPCGAVAGDTLTFDPITDDAEADATGTAAEARIKDSTGAIVVSGLLVRATADPDNGEEVVLDNTSIAAGQQVSVSAASLTHAP